MVDWARPPLDDPLHPLVEQLAERGRRPDVLPLAYFVDEPVQGLDGVPLAAPEDPRHLARLSRLGVAADIGPQLLSPRLLRPFS